jgi:hypothetical protein
MSVYALLTVLVVLWLQATRELLSGLLDMAAETCAKLQSQASLNAAVLQTLPKQQSLKKNTSVVGVGFVLLGLLLYAHI